MVQRSGRLRAGLSPDLISEQVLMRSLKTRGRLTRGRGMTKQQRLLRLLSMTACADINQEKQDLTGVNYSTGERQSRDRKDTLPVL